MPSRSFSPEPSVFRFEGILRLLPPGATDFAIDTAALRIQKQVLPVNKDYPDDVGGLDLLMEMTNSKCSPAMFFAARKVLESNAGFEFIERMTRRSILKPLLVACTVTARVRQVELLKLVLKRLDNLLSRQSFSEELGLSEILCMLRSVNSVPSSMCDDAVRASMQSILNVCVVGLTKVVTLLEEVSPFETERSRLASELGVALSISFSRFASLSPESARFVLSLVDGNKVTVDLGLLASVGREQMCGRPLGFLYSRKARQLETAKSLFGELLASLRVVKSPLVSLEALKGISLLMSLREGKGPHSSTLATVHLIPLLNLTRKLLVEFPVTEKKCISQVLKVYASLLSQYSLVSSNGFQLSQHLNSITRAADETGLVLRKPVLDKLMLPVTRILSSEKNRNLLASLFDQTKNSSWLKEVVDENAAIRQVRAKSFFLATKALKATSSLTSQASMGRVSKVGCLPFELFSLPLIKLKARSVVVIDDGMTSRRWSVYDRAAVRGALNIISNLLIKRNTAVLRVGHLDRENSRIFGLIRSRGPLERRSASALVRSTIRIGKVSRALKRLNSKR